MSQHGLRVALIGVGFHGPLFPKVLNHAGRGSKIVALVDVDSDRLAAAANAMGTPKIPKFQSTEELLSRLGDGIDAVIVSTPATVRDPVINCLEAGKHVFCENPLALDYTTARNAVDISRSEGLVLCTDEQWALLPAMQVLQGAVRAGKLIGEVTRMVITGKGREAGTEFIRIGTHLLHVAQRAGAREFTGCCAYALGSDGIRQCASLLDNDLAAIRATFETESRIPVHVEFDREDEPDVRRCSIELRGTQGRVRAIGGLLEQVWISEHPFDTGDWMNSWQRLYPVQARIDEGAWEIIRPGEEPRVLADSFMNPTFMLWQLFETTILDKQLAGREALPDMCNVAAACHMLMRSLSLGGTRIAAIS